MLLDLVSQPVSVFPHCPVRHWRIPHDTTHTFTNLAPDGFIYILPWLTVQLTSCHDMKPHAWTCFSEKTSTMRTRHALPPRHTLYFALARAKARVRSVSTVPGCSAKQHTECRRSSMDAHRTICMGRKGNHTEKPSPTATVSIPSTGRLPYKAWFNAALLLR